MATANNNKRILHRKEWQMMTPSPAASVAGSFIIKDPLGIKRTTLFVTGNTTQYLYGVDEDAWMQIPSMALAGTFGAGACGAWGQWSNTLTANGGTTGSVTTATGINNAAGGSTIRFLTGSQAGKEVTCTGTRVVPGGTNTLTFSPAIGTISNGDTFQVLTGKYYIMGAGAVGAGIFKSIDPLTGVITSLATTNLPGTWGTEGKMVGTPSYVGKYVADTTSDINSSTTIGKIGKTWLVNNWTNFQVRIVSGTGIGQIRTISSNTATTLTVPTWTVTPDVTSVFCIESNDDFLYLFGNNAVTVYRYSISANTWTVMSPTVARGAAMVAGGGANWMAKTGDATWNSENDMQDGRYIYSFRGGASSALDRFDIAGGTAGAGAWSTITYLGQAETFTTGSSYGDNGDKIYIRKNATNRIFWFSAPGNNLYPFNTLQLPDGAALLGDKTFTARYTNDGGVTFIDWLYMMRNSGTELHRIMIF